MSLPTNTPVTVLTPPGKEPKVKTKVYLTTTVTTAAELFKLPKGAAPIRIESVCSTSVGSVTVSLGSSATTNHYVNAFALTTDAAAIQIVTPVLNSLLTTELAADTNVYGQISAAPSAGYIMINLYYVE